VEESLIPLPPTRNPTRNPTPAPETLKPEAFPGISPPESSNKGKQKETIPVTSMTTEANPSKRGEIKLSPPEVFKGDRTNFPQWLNDIRLYLLLNCHIYDDDHKKIAFTLSYMKGGIAGEWKNTYLIDNVLQDGSWKPMTFITFTEQLKAAFSPVDQAGDGTHQLQTLQQGKGSADEYIAKFKVAAAKSEIKDFNALKTYFEKGLNDRLADKVYALENLPQNMDGWYTTTARLDNHWRRRQNNLRIQRGLPPLPTASTSTTTSQGVPMDIDALKLEKKKQLLREGKCFICEQKGHRSRECPNKKRFPSNRNDQRRNNVGELRKNIRALTAEEKEELMDEFIEGREEEDF
jgi:hypothetical protein